MAFRNRALGAVPMEPGERTRVVRIDALSESQGASGFPIESWTLLTTLYAGRFEDRGTERFRTDQTSATTLTRWEVGYRSDLDPELVDVPKTRRLVHQGRVFDIVAASVIGQREGVELITMLHHVQTGA